jgi:hypothetical protein
MKLLEKLDKSAIATDYLEVCGRIGELQAQLDKYEDTPKDRAIMIAHVELLSVVKREINRSMNHLDLITLLKPPTEQTF